MNTTRLTTQMVMIFTAGSLVLSGCSGSKNEADDVQEKAPPNVIQLAPEAARSVGIQTIPVESRVSSNQLVTTGQINANENRVFHIGSFVSGRVSQDNVFLGDAVHPGQTLAVVENLDVAKTQADYIHQLHQNEIDIRLAKTRDALARNNLKRERQLLADGISPRKDYLQAESEAALTHASLAGIEEHRVHIESEGRALLGAYGIQPGKVHSEKIHTGSPVTSPRSGVVTKKNITLGDMVTPITVMYEVIDLSQVWLNIAIYPKDLSSIQIGQAVSFTTDSLPGKVFTGQINYIQPSVNELNQTYVARAYLSNPTSILKPGMFGQVRIEQPTQQARAFIPETAIQHYGRENFVFIPIGNNRFRKQAVVLGNKVGDGYLIHSGIQPGQTVVAQGSFTLKAELLKSQFAEKE